MSMEHPGRSSGSADSSFKVLLILCGATIVCLVPWINKAFCIDDPLFLWSAAQIQAHPLDFYGCDVNWYSSAQPLYDVTKNPPLACYYLAVAAAVFGWSEPALHAAFLLPAIGAICGTWFLARMFCRDAVAAALVSLATPAFIVSSTNVMCDAMMLCFWTWAVASWVQGFRSGKNRWLCAASCLIGAAALTKYFAISLIPLLGAYAVFYRRKPTWQLAWLTDSRGVADGLPVSDLENVRARIAVRRGRLCVGDCVHAWTGGRDRARNRWLEASCGIVFYRRIVPSGPVLCSQALVDDGAGDGCNRWRGDQSLARYSCSQTLLMALHKAVPFTAVSAAIRPVYHLRRSDSVVGAERRRQKPICRCLLTGALGLRSLWICRVCQLDVQCAKPVADGAGTRHSRCAANGRTAKRKSRSFEWRWALAPAFVVTGMVAWSDLCLANSVRSAAAHLAEAVKSEPGTHWFQGHWGFQYYMHAQGGREVDVQKPDSRPGEVMVFPYNNTDVLFYSREFVEPIREVEIPACRWLATMQAEMGAGFYSAIWGPMPFVFGPAAARELRNLQIET